MKKLNKNFLIFSFIATFLVSSVLLILYKLIPTFFLHTVYYCQKLINSYSIQIPQQINLILPSIATFIFLIFLTKTLVTLIKIHQMKRNLLKNRKEVKNLVSLINHSGLKNKVSIIKDNKPFAFCLGIRNPHIYISTKTISMMSRKQLKVILLHEKYHLEHADSLVLFIASLPQILFPFFPILSKLLDRYKIEREIKADLQAVKLLGTPKPVIEVLKKLLENPSASPVFVSSIAEAATFEIRIKSLLNKKTRSPKIRKLDFLISFLSISFIVVSVAVPVHAIEVHADNQDAMMVCFNGGECAKWCKEHITFIPVPNMSKPYSPAR